MRVRDIEYFCVVKGSEGSRYFIHCFDVRILKWYVGINHIPYFIYAGIYRRTKFKIVLLSHNIGKYADKIFRLTGSHRSLCTKNPVFIPSERTANNKILNFCSNRYIF